MKKIVLTLLILIFMVPAIAQTKAEKKKMKQEKAAKGYALLKDLVNKGQINFEADWATTNTGLRINLIGNPNFLKIDGKKADIDMPFFGTAHSASVGFDGNGGIIFKGEIDNYSVDFNDKKQHVTIKFSTKEKSKSFDFTLTLFGNKNGSLSVSSNSRSNITYSGAFK